MCTATKLSDKAMRCSREGCTRGVQKGGLCGRHGAKVKQCGNEGCTKQAKRGGHCLRHGGWVNVKLCSHKSCTSKARVKGGLCKRHGATVKHWGHEGCARNPSKGEFCRMRGEKVTRKAHGLGEPSEHHQKVRGRYGAESLVDAAPADEGKIIPRPAKGSEVTTSGAMHNGAMRISRAAAARPWPSLLTSMIATKDFDDDEICAWIWRSSSMRTAANVPADEATTTAR